MTYHDTDRGHPTETASPVDDRPFVTDYVRRNQYAGWSLLNSALCGMVIGGLICMWPYVGCFTAPLGAVAGALIGLLLAHGVPGRE